MKEHQNTKCQVNDRNALSPMVFLRTFVMPCVWFLDLSSMSKASLTAGCASRLRRPSLTWAIPCSNWIASELPMVLRLMPERNDQRRTYVTYFLSEHSRLCHMKIQGNICLTEPSSNGANAAVTSDDMGSRCSFSWRRELSIPSHPRLHVMPPRLFRSVTIWSASCISKSHLVTWLQPTSSHAVGLYLSRGAFWDFHTNEHPCMVTVAISRLRMVPQGTSCSTSTALFGKSQEILKTIWSVLQCGWWKPKLFGLTKQPPLLAYKVNLDSVVAFQWSPQIQSETWGKCLSKALWEWGKCLPIPFSEAFAGLGNEVKLGFSASLQCALFQSIPQAASTSLKLLDLL